MEVSLISLISSWFTRELLQVERALASHIRLEQLVVQLPLHAEATFVILQLSQHLPQRDVLLVEFHLLGAEQLSWLHLHRRRKTWLARSPAMHFVHS